MIAMGRRMPRPRDGKTEHIDFEKEFCRCVVHKTIVHRATGDIPPTKVRMMLNQVLPMIEDICDSCHKEILDKQISEVKK